MTKDKLRSNPKYSFSIYLDDSSSHTPGTPTHGGFPTLNIGRWHSQRARATHSLNPRMGRNSLPTSFLRHGTECGSHYLVIFRKSNLRFTLQEYPGTIIEISVDSLGALATYALVRGDASLSTASARPRGGRRSVSSASWKTARHGHGRSLCSIHSITHPIFSPVATLL